MNDISKLNLYDIKCKNNKLSLRRLAKEIGCHISTLQYYVKANKDIKKYVMKELRKCSTKSKAKYWVIMVTDVKNFMKEYREYLLERQKFFERRHKGAELGLWWTESAKICYEHRGLCSACPQWEIACSRAERINTTPDEPPMRQTVKMLLKEIGEPIKEDIDNGLRHFPDEGEYPKTE